MSRLLSVSIQDDLAVEIDTLAKALGTSRSDVVRDALRRHLRVQELGALQQYGREQAEVLGIGPEDTEALVDALRAERR